MESKVNSFKAFFYGLLAVCFIGIYLSIRFEIALKEQSESSRSLNIENIKQRLKIAYLKDSFINSIDSIKHQNLK